MRLCVCFNVRVPAVCVPKCSCVCASVCVRGNADLLSQAMHDLVYPLANDSDPDDGSDVIMTSRRELRDRITALTLPSDRRSEVDER